MTSKRLPTLTAARRAARVYLQDSARARDSQYEFLALAYLAHQEGMRCPRAYQTALEKRLGREPTGPERKRPFLLLLHALFGTEDGVPRDVLPKFSKLTTALEELDRAYSGTKPTREGIKTYIRDAGGIAGLYDLSRSRASEEDTDFNHPRDAGDSVVSIAPVKPSDIPLPALRGNVTKVGRGYRLRLTDFEPGEHLVRIHVGNGGFIHGISGTDEFEEEVA